MTEMDFKQQLAAAQETNSKLIKRILMLENAETDSPVLRELQSYHASIQEKDIALATLGKALDQAVDAIIITDPNGCIEYTNRSFERITGYSRNEAVGQNPSILKSGKQGEDFYKKMWESLHQTSEWNGKIWNRRKNGEIYPEHLSITAIRNDEDVLANYVGVFSDISDLLSLEQQFQQAQKMEAIGTLVGGIAHDFNNMLAGITGNMYLARRKLEEGNASGALENVNRIEGLSYQAAAIISQLLVFARKGIVEMQPLPMNSFVKESLKLARVTIPENIQLVHDVSDEDVLIEGDITQLQQVLLNLFNNARDAVEHLSEPRIELKLCRYMPDDDFVKRHAETGSGALAHLSVSDNGHGIASEHLDQVFDPFFTTKEVGKGTGLGLSMVYGAVQSHAGVIEVESKQGRGTTIHIYLPLIEATVKALKAVAVVESVDAKGEMILLADDELHLRETTMEVLEALGYRVLQASDGLEAIDIFRTHQHEIALVMLDVVMPHLGGIPLAKRIREMNPDVPIIFVTGYDKEHVLGQGVQMQYCEILTKPVNFDALSQSMRQLLD